MRTIYVKPGTKVVVCDTTDQRNRHKSLTKDQLLKCELARLELIHKAQSEPSELETLRAENAILKKKLEEIKSIICGR